MKGSGFAATHFAFLDENFLRKRFPLIFDISKFRGRDNYSPLSRLARGHDATDHLTMWVERDDDGALTLVQRRSCGLLFCSTVRRGRLYARAAVRNLWSHWLHVLRARSSWRASLALHQTTAQYVASKQFALRFCVQILRCILGVQAVVWPEVWTGMPFSPHLFVFFHVFFCIPCLPLLSVFILPLPCHHLSFHLFHLFFFLPSPV